MLPLMMKLSRAMAYLGGAMLTALILLTCLSVAGRILNGLLHGDVMQGALPGLSNWLLATGVAPINGDFELIEAGVAFSVFAFLPLCHLTSGHAVVDIFSSKLPLSLQRTLALVTEFVFAAVMVLIAVQLCAGTLSKFKTGQTTLLLQFPIWWAYALSLVAATIAAIVSIYVALTRLRETLSGNSILPTDAGAQH